MEDASLNVMCTVNIELTAAAIAYGLLTRRQQGRQEGKGYFWCLSSYHWGGCLWGESHCSAEDTLLGGDDFDNELKREQEGY